MKMRIAAGAIILGMCAQPAVAGGFAIREQSAVFQGTAYAGNAAGGAISSMFWNPAAIALYNTGVNFEAVVAGKFDHSEIVALPGSTLAFLGASSGENGHSTVLSSGYATWALRPDLVLGLGINETYGFKNGTEPNGAASGRLWAGMTQTSRNEMKTRNYNPTVSYQVTPQFSIGAGLQVEYMALDHRQATGITATSVNMVQRGDGMAYGFTLGALWQPVAGTSIGLGYRSRITHNLLGDVNFETPPPALPIQDVGKAGITMRLTTPDIVTLSLRQRITDQFRIMGTVEWARWSNFETLRAVCTTGSNIVNLLGCPGTGAVQFTFPLSYQDGWYVSGGAEYDVTRELTLRAGLAWERSPIRSPADRLAWLPLDADTTWVSAGLSWQFMPQAKLDLAYSHGFIGDGQIDRTQSGIRLIADTSAHTDIVSLSLRVKLGPDPVPPAKLITK